MRNVREMADDKMAAKYGASFDANEALPMAEKILQDRVEQGMVMLMLQQGKGKAHAASAGLVHGGKIKMTSESMVKPSAFENVLKVSKPSPRSQEMLKDYCRGNFIGEPDQEDTYRDDDDSILKESKVVTSDSIDVMGYLRQYYRGQMNAHNELFNEKRVSKTKKGETRSGSRSSSEGPGTQLTRDD